MSSLLPYHCLPPCLPNSQTYRPDQVRGRKGGRRLDRLHDAVLMCVSVERVALGTAALRRGLEEVHERTSGELLVCLRPEPV